MRFQWEEENFVKTCDGTSGERIRSTGKPNKTKKMNIIFQFMIKIAYK